MALGAHGRRLIDCLHWPSRLGASFNARQPRLCIGSESSCGLSFFSGRHSFKAGLVAFQRRHFTLQFGKGRSLGHGNCHRLQRGVGLFVAKQNIRQRFQYGFEHFILPR